MQQFVPQYHLEPFTLLKKEKAKQIYIDYYELYIVILDFGCKAHIFNFSTLGLLHQIDLQQDEYQVSFGWRSEFIGLQCSTSVRIDSLVDLSFIKMLDRDEILKFEFDQRKPGIYYTLTERALFGKDQEVHIDDPQTMLTIYTTNQLLILTQSFLLIYADMILVSSFPIKHKKARIKYDECTGYIALLEQTIIQIFRKTNDTITLLYYLDQKVEKISDGCFYTLPYFKQQEFFGEAFIYFAMSRGKLGQLVCHFDLMDGHTTYEQAPYQERKCKTLLPVFRWGHILGHFEQGLLHRVKLFKSIQFEKLDFKFQYLPINDYQQKEPRIQIEKNIYEPLYDPYQVYKLTFS